MAFKDSAKSELQEIAIKSSKNFPLFGTSLASIESLSMPKVHEVVLSADMQCEKCQKRVIDIITKMNEGIEPETLGRSTLPSPKPIPLDQPKWVCNFQS
ncbi:hypothetical protein MTR_5g055200 [Medicago truncatula]|uniref:Heavy metal transport/detoxification superfamily protein n=1 Tax=Medicago truncatula TaxID=3880 RepID=A0A072UDX5_MEDTR|nr:hypothetical protein MTR_5g055200 [Medicago truncatula]